MANHAPRYPPDGDSPSESMLGTSSEAPVLGVKRARSTDRDREDEPRQRPRLEPQMISTHGISGNASVVNVGRDHITHNNDGLCSERHAVLESIEQRLKVVHDAVIDIKVDGWLSAPDVSQNLNAALRRRQAGTGSWFLDGTQFAEWKEIPNTVLCIYGAPGCGKTVLCSSIIEDVKDFCKTRLSGWAYFFFDSRSGTQSLRLYENFLRSVLAQLCSRCGGVPLPVLATYRLHGDGREQPSVKALTATLQQVVAAFDDVYIIVDSLDESGDKAELLRWIETVAGWDSARWHLLITSRPEPDITSRLERIHNIRNIHIQAAMLEKDIIIYLDEQLSLNSYWSAPTRALIKTTLIGGADGMFRWVAMQIDSLQICMNAREVKEKLKTLPKDLEETYEQILAGSARGRDLLQMLHWLAFSARALRLEEIAEVPSVDLSTRAGPRYHPDLKYSNPRIALTVCSGLVTETDGMVKLAHFSVKEYLISDRIKIGSAAHFAMNQHLSHSVIAQTCIAYLLIFNKPDSIQTPVETTGPFPLHLYAAEYTDRHLHSAESCPCPALQELLLDLFLPTPHLECALVNWARIYDPDRPWQGVDPSLCTSADEVASPIYYASLLGLQYVVQRLLQCGTDVNILGGLFGTALHAAAFQGHTGIVKILLQHSVNVDIRGGNYATILQAGAANRRTEIAKILLKRGTNFDLQGGWYGAALQAAAFKGHTEIGKLLLCGADVKLQGGQYGTALQVAVFRGHTNIVKLLLECGANTNIQGGCNGTALQAAAANGHIEIVKLLLERGADANIQGGIYGTALQATACEGHTKTAKLLLQGGADINILSGLPARTALQVAAAQGHTETHQLLLQWQGVIDFERQPQVLGW